MNTTTQRPKIWTHTTLIIGAILMTYPLLWMLTSSFKPQNAIFQDVGLLPSPFTTENYERGWVALQTPFSTFFSNSLVICGLAVLGNVISCSLTAYAFARLNFRLKRLWFVLMLGTIMLPYHVTLVPQYVMFFNLGWVNTFLPLFVPKFLATDAFFIFLNIQFIRGIPRELDEAARVDGAGYFQIYRRIILPLSAPALITTAIFTFIWNWDNFFSHLLYLSDVRLYTVSLALRSFLDSTGESSYGALFAMSVLSLIPSLVFFFAAQRRLVEGISTTGLKG